MAGTRDIRAGRATVELTTKDRLERGLARARARLKQFGRDVQATGLSLVAAGTAILAPLGAALKTFSQIGDGVAKMARRTGLSVQAVQALGFAAKLSGADMESLEKGVRRMQRSIYDAGRGLTTATDAFGDLGLAFADLDGLAPERQFRLLAERLSRVDDASKKAAIAQQIFGRSGTMLLPMFEQGADGLDRLMQRFESLGVTLTREEAEAAERFTDTLTDLWTAVRYGVGLLGAALEPEIRDLIKSGQEWLRTAVAWVRENRDLIGQYAMMALKVGAWAVGIGAALVVVGKLATGVAGLIGVLKTLAGVFAALGAAVGIGTGPLLAVVGVVAAVVYAVYRLTSYTAQLTKEKERALAVADRERATDLAKLERLRTLSAAQDKTAAQMEEAKRLVSELQGRYGDLGLRVNEATGEIEGLAGALGEVEDAMRSMAALQIEEALAETQQNLAELRKETNAFWTQMKEGWEGLWYDLTTEGDDVRSASMEARMDQASALLERIETLQARLAALGRGEAEALTGGAEAEPAAAPLDLSDAEARDEAERELLARLVRLKIEAMEDAHARQLALIRQRYEEEERALKEKGASEQALATLRAARDQELHNARMEHLREERKAREEAAREVASAQATALDRATSYSEGLTREIEEARIESIEDEEERERALLALRYKYELRAAALAGASLERVKELFRLRSRLLDQRFALNNLPDYVTRGTFSAQAAGLGVGTAEMDNLKANRETAANTKELLRQVRMQPGLTFAP